MSNKYNKVPPKPLIKNVDNEWPNLFNAIGPAVSYHVLFRMQRKGKPVVRQGRKAVSLQP